MLHIQVVVQLMATSSGTALGKRRHWPVGVPYGRNPATTGPRGVAHLGRHGLIWGSAQRQGERTPLQAYSQVSGIEIPCMLCYWFESPSSLNSSQLRYDGYETAATVLAKSFSAYPPSAPSSRLSHLVRLGEQMEGEGMSYMGIL